MKNKKECKGDDCEEVIKKKYYKEEAKNYKEAIQSLVIKIINVEKK